MKRCVKITLPITANVIYTLYTDKSVEEMKKDIVELKHKIIDSIEYELQECDYLVETETYDPSSETLFEIDGELIKQ